MTTPFNVEVVQRSADKSRYIYMRVMQYNTYGEPIARFIFKSWKGLPVKNFNK